MKLPFLTLAATASALDSNNADTEVRTDNNEKVECYYCEYEWVVKPNGDIKPISGESNCRDGPLDLIDTKKYRLEGEKDNGYRYKHKCGVVHTIGTETVYEGTTRVEEEFHIFERRAFKISADGNLADHEGELLIQEEGRTCGANRPECGGAYVSGSPNTRPCDVAGQCPCTTCESTRAPVNGMLTYIQGTAQCKQGSEGAGVTEACIVGRSGPRELRSTDRTELDVDPNEVGGTCFVWQETYKNKDTLEIEMEEFVRSCNANDARPMNQWSQIVSSTDTASLCNGDKCNARDLGSSAKKLAYGLVTLSVLLFQF